MSDEMDKALAWLAQVAKPGRELSPDEKRRAAILRATAWISENRPDLSPHLLKYGKTMIDEAPDGRYYVSLGLKTIRGYEYFYFWVDLEAGTIELAKHEE